MNQDTQNKFAAILAVAQAKTANQTVQNFATVPEIKKDAEPIPETKQPNNIAPAKMVSFTILWHEGTGEFDNTTFKTWETAKKAFLQIYKDYSKSGCLGYDKVKVCIKWENGEEITDRIDVGNGNDFNPNTTTFREFLQPRKGVMYQSNLQVGDRVNLSFEDTYLTTDELIKVNVADFIASPNFINDVAADNDTEISAFTIDTLLADIAPVENTLPEKTIQSKLMIVDYSDKAFAVIGETKAIKDTLKALGGRFNMYLSCGAGWIFSKRHLDAVKYKLAL